MHKSVKKADIKIEEKKVVFLKFSTRVENVIRNFFLIWDMTFLFLFLPPFLFNNIYIF